MSRQVAWASGTHGTYLRTTDGGATWIPSQVPDAGTLDFRAVVGFSADEAFLMSAGPGQQSRIYHTSDGGKHWQLQFTNTNPQGFFDSIVFWDSTHGVVLGDPIAADAGKLKFEILLTDDGQNWHAVPGAQVPDAIDGEGAFAASNTSIALAPSASDSNIWFATGGKAARVFHSADRGKTWQVFDTPIVHGLDSAGIFSIAFRDATHGVIAGGDYKRPKDDGPNLAFTEDGGTTWTLSTIHPLAYFSAVAYDRRINQATMRSTSTMPRGDTTTIIATGSTAAGISSIATGSTTDTGSQGFDLPPTFLQGEGATVRRFDAPSPLRKRVGGLSESKLGGWPRLPARDDRH